MKVSHHPVTLDETVNGAINRAKIVLKNVNIVLV